MTKSADQPSRRDLLRGKSRKTEPLKPADGFKRNPVIARATDGVLWALDASGPDCIYLGGDDGLILHFDGSEWTRQSFGTDLPVHMINCQGESQVIAVGWLGMIAERREDTWHYIQGGKSGVDGANPDEVRKNLPLFGLERTCDGRFIAAGDRGRVCRRETDGGWTELQSGSLANLRCVLETHNGSVLIAGQGGTVLRMEGDTFSVESFPMGTAILDMARNDSGDIVAVGGDYNIHAGGFVGRIFQRTTDGWSVVETDMQLPRLRRVLADGNSFLLTGDSGALFKLEGGRLTGIDTEVRYDLHNLVKAGPELLVCGDFGTLLQPSTERSAPKAHAAISSGTWTAVDHGLTSRTLRGVWNGDCGTICAVGDGGTILRYDGDLWHLDECPVNINLHAAWGRGPNDIIAIGNSGHILAFDGTSWKQAWSAGLDVALLAIAGFDDGSVFVAGDDGFGVIDDGESWHRSHTGTRAEIYDVWGTDSEHILAVGGGGTLLRWNGKGWKSFQAGSDQDLFGVYGRSLNSIFIVGLSGMIIEFDGKGWQRVSSGVRSDLHAIRGNPAGDLFAVGSFGAIIRQLDGEWYPSLSGTEAGLRSLDVSKAQAVAVGDGGTVLLLDLS